MDWNADHMVEVTLKQPDDFLKVRETLTRIGVASRNENKLYQSCHILHKQGKYYIVHFKELFLLDGKNSDFSENDMQRRNRITKLLSDWGLVDVVSEESIADASSVSQITGGGLEGPLKIISTLVIIYVITSILTELLSNAATIVIMAPISLEIANQIGLNAIDARAFLLTTCIAASASFVTPIGYQTNTFVYSVGGYKFTDFAKIGIFLNLIYCFGTIALVSFYWDFSF